MARKAKQSGFSLIEMMMVVLILTIVMGVIFQQMISAQRRYKAEETKVELFGQARELMDQFVRDIHQAGYPNQKLYAGPTMTVDDVRLAVGIVSASPTALQFEGDVDGDGAVDSVQYALVPGPTGRCPCVIQRSQVQKLIGNPWGQGTSWSASVEGVVNSNNAFPIVGQSSVSGVGVTADDALFAYLKVAPVFVYYDAAGAVVPANGSISTTSGQMAIRSIRSVRIVLNVIGTTPDGQTGWKPHVSLGAIAKLPNCSFYAGTFQDVLPPVPRC